MDQSYRFDQTRLPVSCPGGKIWSECDTASRVLAGVSNFLSTSELLELPNLVRRNRLIYLNLGCTACALNCSANLEVDGATVTAVELEFNGPGLSLGGEGQQDVG